MVVTVSLSAAMVAEHSLVASQTKDTKAAASRAIVVHDTPLALRDAPGRLGHSSPFRQQTVCGPVEVARKKGLDGAVELSPEKGRKEVEEPRLLLINRDLVEAWHVMNYLVAPIRDSLDESDVLGFEGNIQVPKALRKVAKGDR